MYQDDELNDFSDWDLLISSGLNTILCGDRATLEVTLSTLSPYLEEPKHEWSCTGDAPPPHLAFGTLLATDLERTTVAQQQVLLDWMNTHPAIRVITLSEHSMFDMVRLGVLLERLYYRLNPMYCALSPQCSSRTSHRISAA